VLEQFSRPAFLIACGCNAAFASAGAFSFEHSLLVTGPLTAIAGGLSFVVATILGLVILSEHHAAGRSWIKTAIVFLLLGPVVFWSLQWPAAADLICVARACRGEDAGAFLARAMGDVMPSHVAMMAVALAALFCATRASTATLEELAA
jgi:hypothetical protein